MAELKTQRNDGDVAAFIDSIENPVRKRDARVVEEMMTRLSGEKPRMWGSSIIGYGDYFYTSGSGTANQWFKIGFSPRKQSMTLYIMDGFDNREEMLSKLGPHSTGVSCLYIKDLEKVDNEVVEELITRSLEHVEQVIARGFDGSIPR